MHFLENGVQKMVYRIKIVQLSIDSFGQELGVALSPQNKWAQLANQLPWSKLEAIYITTFPSKVGRAEKAFRLFFGAQLIKQATNLSDVELVNAIRDTPAYQYFIGLTKYQIELSFSPSAMTVFRRRIAPISPELRTIMGDWAKQQLNQSLADD